MHNIVRYSFPKAQRLIDRFHVQELTFDVVQQICIAHRWDAISEETEKKEKAKLENKKYKPQAHESGDTFKQLLARSRYLLFKSPDKWSESQKLRPELLFDLYPDIQQAYLINKSLRMIYNKNTHKDCARLSLAKWYNKVEKSGFKSFKIIATTIYEHYDKYLTSLLIAQQMPLLKVSMLKSNLSELLSEGLLIPTSSSFSLGYLKFMHRHRVLLASRYRHA
jgi:transposase